MIHVKKRHNTNYGTLLKCYPCQKGSLAAINAHCSRELLET